MMPLDADYSCLRVLLIQKDFKQSIFGIMSGYRLRVLLIQKDFKPAGGYGALVAV